MGLPLSSSMGAMLLEIESIGRPDILTDYCNHFIGRAREGGPMQLAAGRAYAAEMYARYDALFERGFDAFVYALATS